MLYTPKQSTFFDSRRPCPTEGVARRSPSGARPSPFADFYRQELHRHVRTETALATDALRARSARFAAGRRAPAERGSKRSPRWRPTAACWRPTRCRTSTYRRPTIPRWMATRCAPPIAPAQWGDGAPAGGAAYSRRACRPAAAARHRRPHLHRRADPARCRRGGDAGNGQRRRRQRDDQAHAGAGRMDPSRRRGHPRRQRDPAGRNQAAGAGTGAGGIGRAGGAAGSAAAAGRGVFHRR